MSSMATADTEKMRIRPTNPIDAPGMTRRRAVPPLVLCNLLVWLVNLALVFRPLGT